MVDDTHSEKHPPQAHSAENEHNEDHSETTWILSPRLFRQLVGGERPWTATEVSIVTEALGIDTAEMWPKFEPGDHRPLPDLNHDERGLHRVCQCGARWSTTHVLDETEKAVRRG